MAVQARAPEPIPERTTISLTHGAARRRSHLVYTREAGGNAAGTTMYRPVAGLVVEGAAPARRVLGTGSMECRAGRGGLPSELRVGESPLARSGRRSRVWIRER